QSCRQSCERAHGIKPFSRSQDSPPVRRLGDEGLNSPSSHLLQLDGHLFKSLKSIELFGLTRPSLQAFCHGLEQDSNFRFLFQKAALTHPSLQLRFGVGFCGISGACGFVPHTSDGALSSFASTVGFDFARLSGNPAYWLGSRGRSRVFAAATNSFWHVGTQSFRNNAGS